MSKFMKYFKYLFKTDQVPEIVPQISDDELITKALAFRDEVKLIWSLAQEASRKARKVEDEWWKISQKAGKSYGFTMQIAGQRQEQAIEFLDGTYWGQVLNGKLDGYGVFEFDMDKDNRRFNRMEIERDFPQINEMQRPYEYLSSEDDHDTGTDSDGLKPRSLYAGQHVADLRQGLGVYYYPSGNRYEGHWRNGKKDGFGIKFLTSGQRYEGEFKAGRQHGYGWNYYDNGDWQIAESRGGERLGLSVHTDSTGKKQVYFYDNGRLIKQISIN